MELIGAVLAGIFMVILIFILHRAGLGIEAWREYRAGKSVDETAEWQAFQRSFEVKK